MKTILVVESDSDVREQVAGMLKLADYYVLTANDGKEGIEIIKKEVPDMIVSAVTMPVIDGYGLLYLLRHDPKTEATPFIFLSSTTDRHEFRIALESGADDFITKPFNNDELLKAVENRFARMAKYISVLIIPIRSAKSNQFTCNNN